MTPKEKAQELVDKYFILLKNKYETWNIAYGVGEPKQCALIAVDEIIEVFGYVDENYQSDYNKIGHLEFWQEVKQEIENL